MVRLGLCCLFKTHPIKFRTTTAAYVKRRDDPLPFLGAIIEDNSDALLDAIKTCSDLGIGSFRINSRFCPVITHPETGYQLDELPNISQIMDKLARAKQLAETLDIRLTFHPDQFVVLNSPNTQTVDKSIEELEYHGAIAELIGADVITLHVGGAYDDKQGAMDRFCDNYDRLSPRVKSRLGLENDDTRFTPTDVLDICAKTRAPLIYDVHHHRCLQDDLSVEEATALAVATWDREPLFHISSARDDKDPRKHADMIDHADWPVCWNAVDALTVEVEAKAKEEAVLHLLHSLV